MVHLMPGLGDRKPSDLMDAYAFLFYMTCMVLSIYILVKLIMQGNRRQKEKDTI